MPCTTHKTILDFRARTPGVSGGIQMPEIFECSACHSWGHWSERWSSRTYKVCPTCGAEIVRWIACNGACRRKLEAEEMLPEADREDRRRTFTTAAAALAYADLRAQNENVTVRVFHLARDPWGRDALFYVRSEAEDRPEADAVTVAIARPDGSKVIANKEELER